MIDRKMIADFSWWYLGLILFLAVLGVVIIYSANHGRPEEYFRHLYIKQIYWILYGLGAMVIAIVVDYRVLSRYAYLIYGLTVLALIYVLINGKKMDRTFAGDSNPAAPRRFLRQVIHQNRKGRRSSYGLS